MPSKSPEGANRCRLCQKTFETQLKLIKHFLSQHNNDRPFSCNLCEATFKTVANVKRHLNEVHAAKDTISCPLCDRKFKCEDYLNRHMKNHHNQFSNGLSQKTQSDDASSETCSFSKSAKKENVTGKKRPSSKKSSSGNVSDADGEEEWQQRPQKKRSAASVSTKKRKTKQASPQSEDDDFHTANDDLSNSLDQQPKKRSRFCDENSKNLKSGLADTQPKINLEKMAEKLQDLTCHTCNKPFNNSDDLQRHLSCHVPPKVYACNRCTDKFMSKSFFEEHMAIHKREDEESQLNRGRNIIGLIRYFIPKQSDLLADGADPRDLVAEYECNLCGVKYDKVKDLKQHVKKTHSNGIVAELFCCTLCSPVKTYENEYNYRAHLETVHEKEENKYMCTHCNFSCRFKINLEHHLKFNHTSVDEPNQVKVQ